MKRIECDCAVLFRAEGDGFFINFDRWCPFWSHSYLSIIIRRGALDVEDAVLAVHYTLRCRIGECVAVGFAEAIVSSVESKRNDI